MSTDYLKTLLQTVTVKLQAARLRAADARDDPQDAHEATEEVAILGRERDRLAGELGEAERRERQRVEHNDRRGGGRES